jgi:hypothetical protein
MKRYYQLGRRFSFGFGKINLDFHLNTWYFIPTFSIEFAYYQNTFLIQFLNFFIRLSYYKEDVQPF